MSGRLLQALAADRREAEAAELRTAAIRELRLQARRLERLADDLEHTGSPAIEVAMDTASEVAGLKQTLDALQRAARKEGI